VYVIFWGRKEPVMDGVGIGGKGRGWCAGWLRVAAFNVTAPRWA
jgi:hypothetical protein